MKRIFFFLLFAAVTLAHTVKAADDTKAQSLMARAAETYKKAQGWDIRFTQGGRNGRLQLMGNCFHLAFDGIESWFDGKTQWSYVEKNREVTVSAPSAEELQDINPYMIVTSHASGFISRYAGRVSTHGTNADKVILTPRHSANIASIELLLSPAALPLRISIRDNNGGWQQFDIRSCRIDSSLTAANFRFNAAAHPDIDVIDLR